MRMAKILTPRLARFALYNSPGLLKTRSNGADVAVIGWQYVRATVRHNAYYDFIAGLCDVIVT